VLGDLGRDCGEIGALQGFSADRFSRNRGTGDGAVHLFDIAVILPQVRSAPLISSPSRSLESGVRRSCETTGEDQGAVVVQPRGSFDIWLKACDNVRISRGRTPERGRDFPCRSRPPPQQALSKGG